MTKWAVITGAAGGIGRALVAEFRQNGYKVIATDQSPRPEGLACDHYIQADLARTVSDKDYAEQVFSEIKQCLNGDGLHALINNAAVQILGGVDTLTREDWQNTLNVNLIAPFLWVQALLLDLEKQHGSVVNISSIHAKLTKKNFVAYATSKAALSGMTKAMAVDVGRRVRVNAIEPAAIETEMLIRGFKGNTSMLQQVYECHPQNRIGSPAEVASLALTLVDSKLTFLHGESIGISGGIAGRLHDPK